jgi:hypothetical protein
MTLCGDRGDAARDRPGLHWCYLAANPPHHHHLCSCGTHWTSETRQIVRHPNDDYMRRALMPAPPGPIQYMAKETDVTVVTFIGGAAAYMPAVMRRMRQGVAFDDAVAEFDLREHVHWRRSTQGTT